MIISIIALATGLLLMVLACAVGLWAYEDCTRRGGHVQVSPWTPHTPRGGFNCVGTEP